MIDRHGVGLSRLRRLPNVRCHRAVPYERVPGIIRTFDVCLMPFINDEISSCADPLKTYEYCALGKPVVSTVPHRAGSAPAPIHVATTADAFIEAIRSAATDDSLDKRRQRTDFARQHTWADRAERFLAAIESVHTGVPTPPAYMAQA